MVGKSRNKIHLTWPKPSSRDLYVLVFLYIKKIDFFKMGSNTLLATEQRVFSDGGMDGGGGGCGPSLRDLFGSLLSVLSRGGLVDRREDTTCTGYSTAGQRAGRSNIILFRHYFAEFPSLMSLIVLSSSSHFEASSTPSQEPLGFSLVSPLLFANRRRRGRKIDAFGGKRSNSSRRGRRFSSSSSLPSI